MRIDKINLIGPFTIKGQTGSEGQIFGFSGSQVTWVTPSGSGVQGTSGPTSSGFICVPVDQIIYGNSQQIVGTMSDSLKLNVASDQFTHGTNSTNIGIFSVVIASSNSTLNGGYSTILGGCNNYLGGGGYCFNTIIGGRDNIIQQGQGGGFRSIIVSKSSQLKNATRSVIIGGKNHYLYGTGISGYESCESAIIGGYQNCICTKNINSTIISGHQNHICDSSQSSVIGGYQNSVRCSCSFAILGGSGNLTQGFCYSVIIGSKGTSNQSQLCNNNSVLIGSYNVATTSGSDRYAFMTDLFVRNNLCFTNICTGYGGLPYCSLSYANYKGVNRLLFIDNTGNKRTISLTKV